MRTLDNILLFVGVLCILLHFQGGGAVIPDITPGPAPIPGEALSVLVIYESGDTDTWTKEQLAILGDAEWRAHVKAQGGEWRQFDDDTDHVDPGTKWAVAMQRPRSESPWLIVSNPGGDSYEGPLPPDPQKMLEAVRGEWP